MLAKLAWTLALAAPLAAGVAAGAPADPVNPAKPCGRNLCSDLRVTAVIVPRANRVGGAFISGVEVVNVGRRAASQVVVTVEVGGELLFAPEPAASCAHGAGRYVCRLGTVRPGVRTPLDFRTRVSALGLLVLRARATSRSRDAHRANNIATASAQVTEPDSVRGRGVRPTAGGGPRPPVTIEVDAISGPAGDDPAGTFWTKYPGGLELRGHVVCVNVSGNR